VSAWQQACLSKYYAPDRGWVRSETTSYGMRARARFMLFMSYERLVNRFQLLAGFRVEAAGWSS
jgi:hypothetical protein